MIEDPEIRDMLLHDDWRNVDYIIITFQMKGDVDQTRDQLILDALAARHPSPRSTPAAGRSRSSRSTTTYQDDAAAVLKQTWESYHGHFIEGGRVIDRGNQGRTTSEGQACAMLRAVYGRPAAFDQVWEWTRTHLQQRAAARWPGLAGRRPMAPWAYWTPAARPTATRMGAGAAVRLQALGRAALQG